MPEQTVVQVDTIRAIESESVPGWQAFVGKGEALTLAAGSSHRLALQAECHSTAFLQ